MNKSDSCGTMEIIGASVAKARLSQLIDRVSKGERFTITRHGVPVAILVPVSSGVSTRDPNEVMEELRRFREAHPLRGVAIRELINKGRRF